MKVVLVTRKGCHLCDQALSLLHVLDLEPEPADIDADPARYELYVWRGPVVLVDGHVVAEGNITSEQLRKALNR